MSGPPISPFGTVRLDGKGIRAIGPEAFGPERACAMREDRLLAGSIARNVSCSELDADLAEVRRVARVAAMADKIARLPMACETLAGDTAASCPAARGGAWFSPERSIGSLGGCVSTSPEAISTSPPNRPSTKQSRPCRSLGS